MNKDKQRRGPGGHGGPGHGPGGGGPMGAAMSGGEKPKDLKGTTARLINYLKPVLPQIIFVLVLTIVSTGLSIVGPKIMGLATDELLHGIFSKQIGSFLGQNISIDWDKIGFYLLWMTGLYVVSGGLSYIQQFIMASVNQKTVYRMRNDIAAKLNKLPIKYFDSRTHGDILSRVTNDVDTISNTLQQSLTQIISSVVSVVGIAIMMLTISPTLTLVTILTLPLTAIVVMMIMKRSQKQFRDNQRELGAINGHVEEMYSAQKIVKGFGYEKRSIEEFNGINSRLYEAGWKSQFLSGLIMPILNTINNIGYVAVCIVGGALALNGSISVGGIQSFITYTRQFTQPISQVANITNLMQSAVAAAERVFEVLDENEEVPEPVTPAVLGERASTVRFENVSFGYSEDNILIKDMDIDVKSGQMVAIVGPTGAGKTTLVNLLMRFYELAGGRITVDGTDITDLSRADLRNTFGMVLQDTWLFAGTIQDNIAYGREGASDMDIQRAAKMAYVDHFVRTLPDGYNTVLTDDAGNISRGQRQLITIARAIVADPSILILDEATSSVDTRTEVLIQKAMEKLMEGRTSFVIAHRLSTIRNADLILVMNRGSIIEQGNHEELIAAGGFYKQMYESQFKGPASDEGEAV